MGKLRGLSSLTADRSYRRHDGKIHPTLDTPTAEVRQREAFDLIGGIEISPRVAIGGIGAELDHPLGPDRSRKDVPVGIVDDVALRARFGADEGIHILGQILSLNGRRFFNGIDGKEHQKQTQGKKKSFDHGFRLYAWRPERPMGVEGLITSLICPPFYGRGA